MFRYLSALFLAIFLTDLAVSALATGRVWVMGNIVLKRKSNPLGYWLVTALWLLIALGSGAGVLYLTYMAIGAAGPYEEHAFFSLDQAWPYAATALGFGWLAFKIVRRRLHFLRDGQDAV